MKRIYSAIVSQKQPKDSGRFWSTAMVAVSNQAAENSRGQAVPRHQIKTKQYCISPAIRSSHPTALPTPAYPSDHNPPAHPSPPFPPPTTATLRQGQRHPRLTAQNKWVRPLASQPVACGAPARCQFLHAARAAAAPSSAVALIDQQCANRVATGAAVGGALGASIGEAEGGGCLVLHTQKAKGTVQHESYITARAMCCSRLAAW